MENLASQYTVLVVDDVPTNVMLVQAILKKEGYTLLTTDSGAKALRIAQERHPNLILLDIMMPEMDGYTLTKELRDVQDTIPILMVSAKQLPADKKKGFLVGTDDYMTKPFAIEELLARIRVNLKKKTNVFELGKLKIDVSSHVASYDGNALDLTKKEFDLLVYLVEHRNKVISREQALDAVWGYDFIGNTNVVDVYVRYLRSKIDDAYGVKLIETVRGFGYVIR